MSHRECKVCHEVKKIKDFYNTEFIGKLYGSIYKRPSWVCKKCAKQAGNALLNDFVELYNPFTNPEKKKKKRKEKK